MQFFCYLGAASCCSLYWFDPEHLEVSFISVTLASIGFWCSYALANSFLPQIASKEEQDAVSARAFSMGYIGSVTLLIANLIAIKMFGMSARWSFVSVGIWWAGFAQITFYYVKETPQIASVGAMRWDKGFHELKLVWNQMSDNKKLKSYLLSFFVFSMGIQTIMQMAAYFGKEINLLPEQLIIAIVLIQFIAIPGAMVFSKISRRIGNLPMLSVALLVWVGVCVFAYFVVKDANTFFAAAAIIGFIMGGTQSLARSTYSKFLPETEDTASFFSFYDVTEKIAIIIGMFSFGYINEQTGSQRNSVLILMSFFIIGLILLFLTRRAEKAALKP